MIIKLNPHDFVIYLTFAMGTGYAIANSRYGWGFWKIAVIALFVLPPIFVLAKSGHSIEVGLGLLLGWLFSKGCNLSLPHFSWLKLRKQRTQQQNVPPNKPRNKKHKTADDDQSERREETKRRAEEAQRQRAEKERQAQQKEEIWAETRTPMEVLGLKVGYSSEDLKRRHRKLSDKYHPDKNQHMSESTRKELEEELVKVNLAFKELAVLK